MIEVVRRTARSTTVRLSWSSRSSGSLHKASVLARRHGRERKSNCSISLRFSIANDETNLPPLPPMVMMILKKSLVKGDTVLSVDKPVAPALSAHDLPFCKETKSCYGEHQTRPTRILYSRRRIQVSNNTYPHRRKALGRNILPAVGCIARNAVGATILTRRTDDQI